MRKTISHFVRFFVMLEIVSKKKIHLWYIFLIEAITESRQMMKGHKWRYFCLNLSFIGWAFLCIFTIGIGYLWLAPYFLTAHAHFYEDLRAREVVVKEAII